MTRVGQCLAEVHILRLTGATPIPATMAAETIAEAIERTAKDPASVSVDGTSVSGQDIDKMIRADEYVNAKAAKARNHCGITFRTLTPGGTG